MGASVFKVNAFGAGLMNDVATVPVGEAYRIMSVALVFAAAPTTSENYTITLDSRAGPTYDLLLYRVDPSGAALTDILWQPDEELFLEGGDAILCEFANTDRVGYTIQIVFKRVP